MNLIDVYTRLKMKIDEPIIVTYYSSYGKKHTKEVILLNIIEFKYIIVEDDEEILNFPFFGIKSMIESITIKKNNKRVYYNPFVNKDIFSGLYIKDGQTEKIKNLMFDGKEFDFKKREEFIRRYNSKNVKLKYDDLFLSKKQKKEFNVFFEFLINELVNYCKKRGLDSKLKYITTGTTSIVYEIGDKVIKIGKPRRKATIPYCEFLLQPIINRDFEFDGYLIHLEVTQKVNIFKNVEGFEILFQMESLINEIQENLRSIGLETTDLHYGNIGTLIDKNCIHYESVNFEAGNDFATSIKYNNNKRILDKGEIVLLDLDSIEIIDKVKYANYLKNIGYKNWQEVLQNEEDEIEQKKVQKCLNKIIKSSLN